MTLAEQLKEVEDHPINDVVWVNRNKLIANDYNPNSQIAENHDLLIESLVTDGWTQPIVVRPAREDGKHVIIDGEHRWRASAKLDRTLVPIVVLDQDKSGCIAATVRHNRARGAHGIENMTAIVKTLRREGMSDAQIEKMLGMSAEERDRLETTEDSFLAMMGGTDGMMK